MGRGEVHSPDAILDAARAVVLSDGVGAATVRAIADAAKAPMGSIYHRFGSRDGVMASMWIRAVKRSQRRFLDALAAHADPTDSAVGGALSVFDFAVEESEDARIAVLFRREDLIGKTPPDLADTLRGLNEPPLRALRKLAAQRSTEMDALVLAVIDLPYGTVRRHLIRGRVPPASLRPVLESAVRAALAWKP